MQSRNSTKEVINVSSYIRVSMTEILNIMNSSIVKADLINQVVEHYIYNLGGNAYLLVEYYIIYYRNAENS